MGQHSRSRDDYESSLDNYAVAARSSVKTKMMSKAKLLGFGAAAASGLFTCSQADADIVHSGKGVGPIVLQGTGTYVLDVDQDGDREFRIGINGFGSTGQQFFFDSNGTSSAAGPTYRGAFIHSGVSTFTNYAYRVAKLSFGNAISVGFPFGYRGGIMAWTFNGTTGTDPWGVLGANLGNPATGFVGVEFFGQTAGGGEAQVAGWVKLRLQAAANHQDSTLTILDFAYENMGNAIAAGQIPEPSTTCVLALATLAMGAAGIRRQRRGARVNCQEKHKGT